MIDNNTPLHFEILAFLFIGIPLAGALWGASIVIAGVSEGLATRRVRRRMGRWQTAFFRGRRPISPPADPKAALALLRLYRGFIVICLSLWLIRIVWRTLALFL